MAFNKKRGTNKKTYFNSTRKDFFSPQSIKRCIFNPILNTNVINKKLWTAVKYTIILWRTIHYLPLDQTYLPYLKY